MTCPRCGSEAPTDARFCPACGVELEATGAAQEERKLVSILFVDQVGSTSSADGADPEDVRDRNRLYFDAVRAPIARFGGVIEKYIGDAVMAVFGAPLAQLDDADRAVRAALAALDAIRELNVEHPSLGLAARAAVCTGEAMVATDAEPSEALATGDVVNTAARLQSAAPPGGLVVGPETFRLTRHSFRFSELRPIEAKGKRDRVPAWLVEATIPVAERPVSDTGLVGRDRELRLLGMLWEGAVEARRPQLVTILGPSGIGKTRLGRELAARVEAGGGQMLWGRSLPYEERTPYRALGQMIRQSAGIYENDPAERAREKLGAAVSTLFPAEESPEATRFLSLLLGLGLDTPVDEPIHLYYAARRFVELLAANAPLLIVFEDLHWADDALLDAVSYLVGHVREAPAFFLALARPEFMESHPTWGTTTIGSTTLPLEPLAAGDARAVVTSLGPHGDAAQVERIVRAAEGNPLFLEELVAARMYEGTPQELPSTVRAAIAARIDSLPPAERMALLHASVIGQTFWREVLAAASGSSDVDAALEALEVRGLVTRRPSSQVHGDVEFGFKHELIQEVAYATIPRASRRSFHAAIAETIERSVDDPGPLAWILAYHWREAGEIGTARAYLIAAAERARDASAVEETFDLFTRALELAGDDERRGIRLRRALALVRLREYERAIPELEDLLAELRGDDEVEALLALSEATLWTERTERTIQLAERTIARIEQAGPTELRPLAVARLCQGLASRGAKGDMERSIELGDRALGAWAPDLRPRALAEQCHLHSNHYYWVGGYERALELTRAAAATGGIEPNSAEFVLRGAGMEGLILAGMGRYEEALAAGEASIATARRMGRGDSVVMNYSTLPLREIFALPEAFERSATVTDRLGPSSFNMPWMNARADLIGVRLLMDDIAGAETAWPSAFEDATESYAWERWLISGRLAAYRAELDLRLGRADDAVTWADRALDLARIGRRTKYRVVGLLLLGRALAARSDLTAAQDRLRSAVAEADSLGSPLLRWQTRDALAAVARTIGAPDTDDHLAQARAIIEGIAGSLSVERAAVYLDAQPVAAVLDPSR